MPPSRSSPASSVALTSGFFPLITVGGTDADLPAFSGLAIQIAIDAVAAGGGGTVQLAAGAYHLCDSLRLRPGVILRGVGAETLLCRGPLVWGPLAIDADKSETTFTPRDIGPWRVGMGVCMRDRRQGWVYSNHPYRITAISEGTCRLHDHMSTDTWAEEGGMVVNYFPMILIHQAEGAVVEDLAVDAAVEDPEGILAGQGSDAIYVWRSPRTILRRLVVSHARRDGICFSNSSVGTLVEDCIVRDCLHYGIHPGSHSADCIVRRCHIEGNGYDGLYICWGIRRGQFLDNVVVNNGIIAHRSGICIGHKDTDCLIAGNRVVGNRKHGIAFRRKTAANGAHRTVVRGNVIEDNGSPSTELAGIKAKLPPQEAVHCGIHVEGMTRDLVIEDNIIRETRADGAKTQRHAIVIESGATAASLRGNVIEGHPDADVVDHGAAAATAS